MAAEDPRSLAFDDVVIDFAGRRLLRAGEVQALEPKAFGVLALLVGAPGHAFSRDQILDAVWGHRHVTPGVLNRVMTLLRHALGEEAHAPRYLHTLHGVGYRFDLPEPAPAAQSVAATPAAPMSASPANGNTPSHAESEDLLPRRDSAHAGRRTSDRAAAGLRFSRSAVLVLALMLVAAAAAWWLLRPPPASPAPALAAAPVLAVLPLRALGDDPRGEAFADGLSEELIGLLARIDGLRVTSRTSSFQFRDPDAPVGDIARRLQATHVLEGSVRQDGERLRIGVRLIDAARDDLLWSHEYDRQTGDIFVIQDNIARAVGAALQLQLQVGATPGAAAQEDPALYRRYLLARGLSAGLSAQTGFDTNLERAAVDDLRGLVAEHPDYARAWGGLAAVLSRQAVRPNPGRDAQRAESERAAATALALDPRQADALSVFAGQACREQRWHDCMQLSRGAVQEAPSDTLWRIGHANRLAAMGYVEAALQEVDAAQTLDPLTPVLHFWRGRLLDTLGRHDEALVSLQRAEPRAAETALFFNAAWRGDHASALRMAAALPAETAWRRTELAAAAALADPSRWSALPPLLAASERQTVADGLGAYDFTRLLLPQRDYARDIAGLDRVQREGYASYQWVFWQPESHALRQHPAFQAYLRRSGLLAYWREHGWPDVCRSDGGDGVVCD